ncbi:helix-turn-helix transcriptional regulator [Spirosoma taeanense]|uniref:Helix-turn-helix transcriptional regulator n=1 Tax=Spirosoma taeanense TaxID=2735870 RepID=A0A6M5Y7V2_9BACT|nr:AraC family transcriptional regulator [Spirosoma taeanense]QJW89476.1 helix-turn-helix transcriptional regulator [Spirosoma taeanense]
MSLLTNSYVSRQVEGSVSGPCPPNQAHLNNATNTSAGQTSTSQLVTNDLTENLCYEGAMHLQQQEHPPLTRLPALKPTTRQELYRRLLLAKEFIHDNFSEAICLSDMAAVACLSDYHFLRSFKAAFGESPYQYVLRLRLQKAGDLLRFSPMPIGEVALACGFDEAQAFGKLFRKQHGLGPLRYRQSLCSGGAVF